MNKHALIQATKFVTAAISNYVRRASLEEEQKNVVVFRKPDGGTGREWTVEHML